jgi:myo-inositol-1(or 4)-monophosphatase
MLPFIVELAREAGALLRDRVAQPRELTFKSRADLVTDVDLASERLLVGALRKQFPDHAIVAEEGGGQRESERYVWLIDPVDGTTNYAHGYPVFCVTMALLDQGELALGIVYDPIRDECFTAERGGGAWLNGRQLRVSAIPALREALISTGFPYARFTSPDTNIPQFGAMIMQCQGIVRSGSAAIDLAYVAAGRTEGHWELGLNPWDSAAGALLIREAGGQVTTWDGQAYDPWNKRVVATNGLLHRELLDVLAATGSIT